MVYPGSAGQGLSWQCIYEPIMITVSAISERIDVDKSLDLHTQNLGAAEFR